MDGRLYTTTGNNLNFSTKKLAHRIGNRTEINLIKTIPWEIISVGEVV